jgi:hypothetical protein
MAIRVTGSVARLYPTRGATYIRLNLAASDPKPKDEYFRLAKAHDNYNALYALALSSAINGYRLQIRTTADITPTDYANVEYFVVDF